jgi:hypothetical protein
MSGHTPGPWSVPHFAQPDVNCNCEYVLTDYLMGAVCAVYASGKGDDWQKHGDNPRFAEAVANAHLIAAAPDMLTALKTLDAFWTKDFPDGPGDASEPADTLLAAVKARLTTDTIELWRNVRSAIAKAEGRAS